MLHALNDIATVTSKGTEATLAAVEYFLNYALPAILTAESDTPLAKRSFKPFLTLHTLSGRKPEAG